MLAEAGLFLAAQAKYSQLDVCRLIIGTLTECALPNLNVHKEGIIDYTWSIVHFFPLDDCNWMLLDCCVKLNNCSPTPTTQVAQPVALATLGKNCCLAWKAFIIFASPKKVMCMQTLNKLQRPDMKLLGPNMKPTYLIILNIEFYFSKEVWLRWEDASK